MWYCHSCYREFYWSFYWRFLVCNNYVDLEIKLPSMNLEQWWHLYTKVFVIFDDLDYVTGINYVILSTLSWQTMEIFGNFNAKWYIVARRFGQVFATSRRLLFIRPKDLLHGLLKIYQELYRLYKNNKAKQAFERSWPDSDRDIYHRLNKSSY